MHIYHYHAIYQDPAQPGVITHMDGVAQLTLPVVDQEGYDELKRSIAKDEFDPKKVIIQSLTPLFNQSAPFKIEQSQIPIVGGVVAGKMPFWQSPTPAPWITIEQEGINHEYVCRSCLLEGLAIVLAYTPRDHDLTKEEYTDLIDLYSSALTEIRVAIQRQPWLRG